MDRAEGQARQSGDADGQAQQLRPQSSRRETSLPHAGCTVETCASHRAPAGGYLARVAASQICNARPTARCWRRPAT